MNEITALTSEVGLTTVEIAELTGKEHRNVKRDAETMLTELYKKTDLLRFEHIYLDSYGREQPCYQLPKNEVLILCSGYSIPLRAAIVRRLDELEKQNKLVVPNFTNPAEAARAWALEYEEKQKALAMVERKNIALEEIIETRSWIQNKKVATAMATASAKARENEKLKEQIGDSKTYKQVKAISWLSYFFDLKNAGVYIALGNQLKKMSDAMRYPCRILEDSRYSQGVKAYHVDVIEALRLKLITDLNMMRKYRI